MIREMGGRARLARLLPQTGFTLTELIVYVALVGLLSVISVPFFVSYYQAAAARADIQTVITIFNQARELAIKQNNPMCVTVPDNAHVVLRVNTCGGTTWIGPGTDSVGNISLPAGFTISPLNAVTFDYLGAAAAAQTYTMTNSTTGSTMTFSIAITGRITSP